MQFDCFENCCFICQWYIGYAFLTNANDAKGGLYLSPQIGYHNEKWNFYGYYQHTFADNDLDIQVIGLGTTYNIMF